MTTNTCIKQKVCKQAIWFIEVCLNIPNKKNVHRVDERKYDFNYVFRKKLGRSVSFYKKKRQSGIGSLKVFLCHTDLNYDTVRVVSHFLVLQSGGIICTSQIWTMTPWELSPLPSTPVWRYSMYSTDLNYDTFTVTCHILRI